MKQIDGEVADTHATVGRVFCQNWLRIPFSLIQPERCLQRGDSIRLRAKALAPEL
jgi:hypothetical protein